MVPIGVWIKQINWGRAWGNVWESSWGEKNFLIYQMTGILLANYVGRSQKIRLEMRVVPDILSSHTDVGKRFDAHSKPNTVFTVRNWHRRILHNHLMEQKVSHSGSWLLHKMDRSWAGSKDNKKPGIKIQLKKHNYNVWAADRNHIRSWVQFNSTPI